MTKEVAGINLDTLEDPIRVALKGYEAVSEDRLKFDMENMSDWEMTPHTKPNSARRTTDVSFENDAIGKLFVIAFKPGDGSGDEKNGYKLEHLLVDKPYPRSARVVPRNKTGTHSEGHLAIMSHKLADPHADPELFGGRFDLLGLDGKLIKKIGELGQKSTVSVDDMTPITTLTVGIDEKEERFGDPHAVFNSRPYLQICAFLAVTDELYQSHPDILNSLNAQLPRQS